MNKAIYWFRNNLRLHDNPSLNQALLENEEVIPVLIFPADHSTNKKVGLDELGDHRKKFLFESVEDLKACIYTKGGQLSILQGDPVEVLPELATQLNIQKIYASKEVGYNEVQEEVQLPKEVDLVLREDQFLVNPEEAPYSIDNIPKGFSTFRKKVEKHWQPREPQKFQDGNFSKENHGNFEVPKLDVETDPRSAHPLKGGETSGLARLHSYLWATRKIEGYKFTRNQLVGVDFSSKFSAFLALGCLSPIQIYSEIERYEREQKKNISTYWLKFELLWREFFRYVSLKHGRQLFRIGGIQQKDVSWPEDKEKLRQWIDGETTDDFVNANMIELAKTGFMSNRGRQNAASYLVHDFGVDWRLGADYFEKMLVDYDCASNWCNWMYVAGVGNDTRNKKFDTHWQADKYDAKRKFRDLWL